MTHSSSRFRPGIIGGLGAGLSLAALGMVGLLLLEGRSAILAFLLALAGLGTAGLLAFRLARRLALIARALRETARGDLEARVIASGDGGVVGAIEQAANDTLDIVDAFVREAGGAMGAAAEGRYYRKVLLAGLPGAFREAASVINAAGAALEEKAAHLAEATRTTLARRLASLPALIYEAEISPDGGFHPLYASENTLAILGWPAARFLQGEAWRQLVVEEPPEAAAAFYRGVLIEGWGTREYRLRRPEGELIWVSEYAKLAGRREDGSAEIIGYIADVSKQRSIAAKAEVSARLATLGEMATGLAHELNQPLTVMSLAAENAARSLRQGGPLATENALRRLDRIETQAQRARDIVDHLRIFGRRDDRGLVLQPTNLRHAIEGAVVLTGAALRGAGISVNLVLPARLPSVRASLVPLEQVLTNLLLNARDAIGAHTPAGAPEGGGEITIEAVVEGERVRLDVSDTGGGIPPEALERLFEPFFTTKEPGKGTGLGLAICHSTMKSFGGEVQVGNHGPGARFRLTFLVEESGAKAAAG